MLFTSTIWRAVAAIGFAGGLALMFVAPPPSLADDDHHFGGKKFRIAPVNTKPGGQTYGRWAAEWWQYGLAGTADTNPILDTTGENCTLRQVDDVWFLVGSFGSDPVIRSCTVPKGTSLFFPLVNSFFGLTLLDPPEERAEREELARESAKCTVPAELEVYIDNFKIASPRLDKFFTGETGSESPIFNVQLTPGNPFGVMDCDDENNPACAPELLLSPSAEQGYYLFLRPLSPGEHTIHWVASGCTQTAMQDITYHLTVE